MADDAERAADVPADELAEVDVRPVADEAQSREWAVVLQAAGVPCRIDRAPHGWRVVVSAADAATARAALAAYEADVAPPADATEWGPTWAGLALAAALVAIAPVVGFRSGATALFRAGEGDAALVVAGESWRAVTALTLHADPTHLVGNVAAMAVFATAVCRLLGPGLGVALVVTAGALGNLVNAWLHGGPHVSVGASTAIFGAVGVLAGRAVVHPGPRGRRWMPLAAGLALLAFLGVGERSDLGAHFFGFLAGLGLGLGVALRLQAPPGRAAQRALAIATGTLVAACWMLAAATLRR